MWNERLLFCVSVNQEACNQAPWEGTSKQHIRWHSIAVYPYASQDVFRILYQTYNYYSL